MKRRFVTLDVFADRRFAGNPLAVVLDAGGLDNRVMQTIAAEFNLSETVFVLPPDDPSHRARYRIFTPKRELDFAGHPTVGTAVLLGCLDGGTAPRDFVLACNIGPVSSRVAPTGASAGRATFDLPALPTETGPAPRVEALAAALTLAPDDIGSGDFAAGVWSAGVPFTIVPLKSLEAVRRAKPVLAEFESALSGPGHGAVFLVTAETLEPASDFHARMFAPGFGILEDPATGAAVAAFAGALAQSGRLKDGHHSLIVEQGYEMGRPSLIELGMTLASGVLRAASLGGNAVMVTEGTIEA
ncbi:MAG: PhzF family phenazine biosynthesis protein [Pseudolabrys sp.]|nr:PhzF family phenazine biosynthesis protein [Pseudolabrys sp.]